MPSTYLGLFAPGAKTPAWEGTVRGDGGVTLVMGIKELEKGWARMFESAGGAMQKIIGKAEFKAALEGP